MGELEENLLRKHDCPQELNNIRQKDMSVFDYTVKIKSICDPHDHINIKSMKLRWFKYIWAASQNNLGGRKSSFVLRPSINIVIG